MIKKLRLRFVGVAMIAVFVVLAIMLGVINVTNFQGVAKNADLSLEKISQTNFEEQSTLSNEQTTTNEGQPSEPEKVPQDFLMREKFFVATLDGDGNLSVDLSKTGWIAESEATSMAQKVFSNKQNKGYCGDFRFLMSENSQTIWFLDCKNELQNANNFLTTSLIVGGVGIFCVFVLTILFSGAVLRPVEESYKKQKQFITNAAHELKTPLTVISLNNQLEEMKSGENENTKAISLQVKNMTEMVQNLLTLARLDEQVLKTNKQQVNLTEVLKSQANNFEKVLKANKRTFKNELKQDVFVKSDEVLLKQMLSIFFDNASKYAKKQTIVSGQKTSKKFVLTVKNDTNMENGNMDKCFERFFRSDEARASGIEGSGIGLSVAKEISKIIGAKLKAYVQNKMFVIEVEFKC